MDYYQVLQVDPRASAEIIAEAYWALVRKAQSARSHDEANGHHLKLLNEAYSTLIHPDLRERHNEQLGAGRVNGAAVAPPPRRSTLFGLFRSRSRSNSGKRETWYELLQVDPAAETEVVSAAYSCLRRQHGSDLWRGPDNAETLDRLARAITVLSDPGRRAGYDAELFGERNGAEIGGVAETAAPKTEAASSIAVAAKPPTPRAEKPVAPTPQKRRTDRGALARGVGRVAGRAAVFLARVVRLLAIAAARGTRWAFVRVIVPGVAWIYAAVIVPGWRRLMGTIRGVEETRAPPLEERDDLDEVIAQRLASPAIEPALQESGDVEAARPLKEGTPIAYLVIRKGPHAGASFVVTDRPISVGTDHRCDIILAPRGSDVAPMQLRIWYRENRYMVHHVSDTATTLINDRPVTWGVLETGDLVQIGPHEMTFTISEGAQAGGEKGEER